jgi:hypothetical protein
LLCKIALVTFSCLQQQGATREDDDKVREEILSLIAHHVTAVNYIYRDTKFDGRFDHRNIKFEVQRIKVSQDLPVQCVIDYLCCYFLTVD